MSLEQTLEQTNTLLAQLIAVVTTGVEARATLGEPEAAPKATTRTRKTKDEPAAATTTDKNPLGLVDGDPDGTRYWVIEKHNTVYAQKPGDPDCSIEGAKIESAAYYLEKKAEFAKKSPLQSQPTSPEPTTGSAGTPVANTPAASSASSQKADGEVPFTQIVERITVLNKSPEPGHGRDGVMAILKKYLPDDAKPTVTKLQPLGRNAEILADIEAALAPAAEEEFDPLA